MKIKHMKADILKPHPKNPRIHPDSAIDKLERSIKEFGWTNPILISADGFVLAGHARLKAAKQAGLEEVPVVELPLEGQKAEAYMIADNRLQEEASWDYEMLANNLNDINAKGLDVQITGFDTSFIDDMSQAYNAYGDALEENQKTIICPECGFEFNA